MMIDDIDDRRMREAFDQFGAESVREAPQPDVAVVRRIAHRRRTTRLGLAAVVTVIAVALPLTVYVLAARIGPAPVHPPAGPPVTVDDIEGATLVIPPWGVDVPAAPPGSAECPSGLVDMSSQKFPATVPIIAVEKRREGDDFVPIAVPVDVDRDGAAELAILLSCRADSELRQVIVVGRDDAG